MLGTLDYASPEQLRDAAKADKSSDLYSVGCTLYFALSGRPRLRGAISSTRSSEQRMEDPEPLENRARGVPSAFAAVVRKLMNKNPEERYQSCAELRGDLMRWTDPARVRAILGAEADAARSFRPPPPELGEEDLRLLDDEPAASYDSFSLRDLGNAEPSLARAISRRCLHWPPSFDPRRAGNHLSRRYHVVHQTTLAGSFTSESSPQ